MLFRTGIGHNHDPTVVYTASGTFATPPICGVDRLGLAGQAFSITILAIEALKPTRHNKTSALFDTVPLSGPSTPPMAYQRSCEFECLSSGWSRPAALTG